MTKPPPSKDLQVDPLGTACWGLVLLGLLAPLVGCGRLAFEPLDDAASDGGMDASSIDGGGIDGGGIDGGGMDGGVDAGSDGGNDAGTVLGPFAAPTPITELSTISADDPTLTADRLEIYFNRTNDIYRATRLTTAAAWTGIAAVAELNSTSGESSPEVSGDGLTIYFSSARGGEFDIWMASRASRTAAWSAPTHVAELSGVGAFDSNPTMRSDGLELTLSRGPNAASRDVYRATRGATSELWGPPTLVTELSGTANDAGAMIARGGTLVFFFSNRSGTEDLYMATRSSDAAPFGSVIPLAGLNTAGNDGDPWISEDGLHLVFARDGQLLETSR